MNDNQSDNNPAKVSVDNQRNATENRGSGVPGPGVENADCSGDTSFKHDAKLASDLDHKVIELAKKMLEMSCLEAEKSLTEQTGWLKEKCKAMQKEAMAKGINEGIKEGIKEGLKVGRYEGAMESERETLSLMVERMLMHGFRPASAASITGLPLAQIMRIASALKDKIN